MKFTNVGKQWKLYKHSNNASSEVGQKGEFFSFAPSQHKTSDKPEFQSFGTSSVQLCLAPSHLCLFPKLKVALKGQHSLSLAKIEVAVHNGKLYTFSLAGIKKKNVGRMFWKMFKPNNVEKWTNLREINFLNFNTNFIILSCLKLS